MAEARLAPGFRRLALGATGSTNAEAFAAAARGEAGGLWITAERQTAGRGRRGRPWVSEPGNLYASLLLVDPAPAAALGQLPLVAAVALAEAIERALRACGLPPDIAPPVALKWPNDVLLHGRKVSGILLEAQALADGRRAVVLGFGVNCVHRPEGTETPAIALAEAGFGVSPDLLFGELAASLAALLDLWGEGRGFALVRARWLARAVGLGEAIRVRFADRETTGRFESLDETGRLVLLHDDGRREAVAAGDVFLPAAR